MSFEGTSRLYIPIPNGEPKLPICMYGRYGSLCSYLSIVLPFLSGDVCFVFVLLLILGFRFKCGRLALVALQCRGVNPRVTRTRPSFPYEGGVEGKSW